jgi:CRP-like cAMP-binding protein
MEDIVWTSRFQRGKSAIKLSELKHVPLFEGLSGREVKELGGIAYIRKYKDGETIFAKGDPGHGLFILMRGAVEVYLKKGTKEKVFGTYEPYQYFGEYALIKDNTRNASARAVGETIMCYLFRDDLRQLLLKNPKLCVQFYTRILGQLIDKLGEANARLLRK